MTAGMTADDGEIERIGDQVVLRFERQYSNPIDDVWDALTNPTRIAQWWLPFDAEITLELVAGGAYELRGKGEGMPTLSWKILRVEAPHLLEHTHVEPDVVIRWELAEHDGGCTLVFTQTVPDRAHFIQNSFAVGTHTSLDRLGSLLQGKPIEWDWDAMAAHQRRYAAAGLATSPEE
ncbi:MAG TPA: SRPBCC family protein [Acidimicrobiales bacterium]